MYQIKLNQIKPDQIKSDQLHICQIKLNQISPDQIKSNQLNICQIKSNQIRQDQIKSDQGILARPHNFGFKWNFLQDFELLIQLLTHIFLFSCLKLLRLCYFEIFELIPSFAICRALLMIAVAWLASSTWCLCPHTRHIIDT